MNIAERINFLSDSLPGSFPGSLPGSFGRGEKSGLRLSGNIKTAGSAAVSGLIF
jgi:hypothetical protein